MAGWVVGNEAGVSHTHVCICEREESTQDRGFAQRDTTYVQQGACVDIESVGCQHGLKMIQTGIDRVHVLIEFMSGEGLGGAREGKPGCGRGQRALSKPSLGCQQPCPRHTEEHTGSSRRLAAIIIPFHPRTFCLLSSQAAVFPLPNAWLSCSSHWHRRWPPENLGMPEALGAGPKQRKEAPRWHYFWHNNARYALLLLSMVLSASTTQVGQDLSMCPGACWP